MDQLHQTIRDPLSGSARTDFELTAMANPSPRSEHWERFAQEDPYTYICTTLMGADTSEFWQSGARTIQEEVLPLLELYKVRPLLSLELGCGIGRLVCPLASQFQEAVGVDIARGMVHRAVSFARENGIENASFLPISGPQDFLWAAEKYVRNCDFIYSLLVFQHIEEFSIIEGYLQVIRVLLHKQGLAYLQFDTRPRTLSYRLKNRLPDFLLPRFWRKGIRRIRRSSAVIEACIRGAGMQILGELTPHTAYHRYILRLS
jgi:cyclopropane fatty-acyl-phospholipid synthase-like methyltransferase